MALAFALATPCAVLGQSSDLQRQIAESRLRLEEIRAERARLQTELDQARGGMRDASRELANIERQLSASRSVLAEIELQLRMAENATDDNSKSLLITRDRQLEATAVLHRRLREVYKLGALHTVRVLLGADSFADLLNRSRRSSALHDLAMPALALITALLAIRVLLYPPTPIFDLRFLANTWNAVVNFTDGLRPELPMLGVVVYLGYLEGTAGL